MFIHVSKVESYVRWFLSEERAGSLSQVLFSRTTKQKRRTCVSEENERMMAIGYGDAKSKADIATLALAHQGSIKKSMPMCNLRVSSVRAACNTYIDEVRFM